MRSQSVQLVTGQSFELALPFWAQSVQVDNPGGRYVICAQANVTVPPYQGGVVAVFAAATNVVRVNTVPPAGQHTNEGGSPAIVTFYEERLSPSPGQDYLSLMFANQLQAQYSLAAGATLAATLTFWANSVKIDNPGGQWLNVTTPAGVVVVPPETVGRVIALNQQSQTVAVTTTPPTGQQNTAAGSAATIIYTDALLPDTPGSAFGQNLAQQNTATGFQGVSGTGTGPAAGVGNYITNGAPTPANGVAYRLAWLSASVSSPGAAAGSPYAWQLLFGPSGTAGGSILCQGSGDTGSGPTAGAHVTGSTGPWFASPPDSRPNFVGDGSQVVKFNLQTPGGGGIAWALNSVYTSWEAWLVPATL